jgi:hypothetical protein
MNLPTLNLTVEPKVFTKIKKIADLSGMNSSEISFEISKAVDSMLDEYLVQLTREMLESCGVNPELLSGTPRTATEVHTSGFVMPAGVEPLEEGEENTGLKVTDFIGNAAEDEEVNESNDWGDPYVPPKKEPAPIEEDPIVKATGKKPSPPPEPKSKGAIVSKVEEDEDLEEMFSDGGEESEFSSMDEDLPEDLREELIFPGDTDMKDKDGNNAKYEDEFMADIQEEFGEDFEEGFDPDPAPTPAKKKIITSSIPNDVADNELDLLPVDIGIQKVSSESGDASSSADFFMAALNGQTGDKSRRNAVRNVRKNLEY